METCTKLNEGICDIKSEIFLPKSPKPLFNIQQKIGIAGFHVCVFKCQGGMIFFGCMAVES